MDVFRCAVASAVVAMVAGQQLSTLEPAQRKAIWASIHHLAGDAPTEVVAAPRPASVSVPPSVIPASAPGLPGDETIAPDHFGQFHTSVEITGQRFRAMIDTGASFLLLTYEDAARLGIRPTPSDFKYSTNTANGRAFVAKIDLPMVRLGSIEVRNVPALVSNRGQLWETLIGMSFLSRLSGVRVDHGHLLLSR